MPIKDQKELTDFYYKVNDGAYKKLCIADTYVHLSKLPSDKIVILSHMCLE